MASTAGTRRAAAGGRATRVCRRGADEKVNVTIRIPSASRPRSGACRARTRRRSSTRDRSCSPPRSQRRVDWYSLTMITASLAELARASLQTGSRSRCGHPVLERADMDEVIANKHVQVLIPPTAAPAASDAELDGGRYAWMRYVLATELGERLYRNATDDGAGIGHTDATEVSHGSPQRQDRRAHRVAITDDDPQPHQATPPPDRHRGGLKRPLGGATADTTGPSPSADTTEGAAGTVPGRRASRHVARRRCRRSSAAALSQRLDRACPAPGRAAVDLQARDAPEIVRSPPSGPRRRSRRRRNPSRGQSTPSACRQPRDCPRQNASSWRTGGVPPRAGRDSPSFSRGHQTHDVVAACGPIPAPPAAALLLCCLPDSIAWLAPGASRSPWRARGRLERFPRIAGVRMDCRGIPRRERSWSCQRRYAGRYCPRGKGRSSETAAGRRSNSGAGSVDTGAHFRFGLRSSATKLQDLRTGAARVPCFARIRA